MQAGERQQPRPFAVKPSALIVVDKPAEAAVFGVRDSRLVWFGPVRFSFVRLSVLAADDTQEAQRAGPRRLLLRSHAKGHFPRLYSPADC
jgi:hypothetical protein